MTSPLLEPDELLAAREDRVLIDTRPADDYRAGHLPGAISLPDVYDYLVLDTGEAGIRHFHRVLGEIFGRAGLTGAEQVVFYENATGMRGARGWWLAEYAGHPAARVLHGGLAGWVAAGGEVTREPAMPGRTVFPVRPRPELLATAGEIAARCREPGVVMLDVRRQAEYRGEFYQECCARFGRVPGAVWFHWERALKGGRFRPLGAIRAELEALGVTPDRTVIPYCHRGARSANTTLALRLLGFPDVRNSIGSWHEWSHRADLPLEAG